MTGFGRELLEYNNKKICIDVKSLNSKQTDISTRIPIYYKEKDLEIRKLLSAKLIRGKIDFIISVEHTGTDISSSVNTFAVENYYQQIKSIAENKSIPISNDILSTILRLPEVLQSESKELDDEEWQAVLKTTDKAVKSCIDYRKEEGKEIEKDILLKIKSILKLLTEIQKYEKERIELLKKKLKDNLDIIISNSDSDNNRYEQEIIYYLEKLDINEEKSRLEKHCNYFIETLNREENQGKKLGFIAQEIGREINTLGSKANHAEMQKIVINMKDELEKIKEQLFNVL